VSPGLFMEVRRLFNDALITTDIIHIESYEKLNVNVEQERIGD
jgi:hypothetical protein